MSHIFWPQLFRRKSVMATLRDLISTDHARGLRGLSLILDAPVTDPLHLERTQRIQAQVVAGMHLRELLISTGHLDMQCPDHVEQASRLDLMMMVDIAYEKDILQLREAQILRTINFMANEAKHRVHFETWVPRLVPRLDRGARRRAHSG